MWLLVARQPVPDAEVWPGRPLMAAGDAVAWPVLWVWALQQMPGSGGIVVPLLTALAVLSAISRVHTALWLNHRYRFTTWRWGKVAAGLMLIGLVLKLMLGAG